MTISGERCFELWAPDDSLWSAWVKPVLFSQIRSQDLTAEPPAPTTAVLPRFRPETAVVVDLDGRESVRTGLNLARQGWRPIPLFNATMALRALVDMRPVMSALLGGAEGLDTLRLPAESPPAFLLDSRRMTGRAAPGAYDNRSVVLPQDFPSATMLISRGIRSVVLLQLALGTPREDLRHVLLRWQQAGIELRVATPSGQEGPLAVAPPSLFRKAWHRMIVLFGLRRSNVGGFGAVVPEETSSGGYYG